MPVTLQPTTLKYKNNGTWSQVSCLKGDPGVDVTSGLIAPDYSVLTFPVAAGKLCRHSGGLFQAKQNIQTSEEWTAAHWKAVLVDDLNTALNESITLSKNVIRTIEYDHAGEYIVLNGETADVTDFVSSSNYESVVVGCEEGDVFVVSAGGQNATRAWAFVASNGTVLAVENANARINNKVLVAPVNSAYFVSNNHTTGDYGGDGIIYQAVDPYAVSTNRVINIPDEQWENGTYAMTPTDHVYSINDAQNRIVCRIPIDVKTDNILTAIPKDGYTYRILFSSTADVLQRSETYLLCYAKNTNDSTHWHDSVREISFADFSMKAASNMYGVVVTIAKSDNSNISPEEGHDALTIIMGKDALTKGYIDTEMISGLTEYNTVKYSLNLGNGAIDSSGDDVGGNYFTNSCRTNGYIDINGAFDVKVSLTRASGATIPSGAANFYTYLFYYDSSKAYISRYGGPGMTYIHATRMPSNAKYIRVSFTYTKYDDLEAASITGTQHINDTPTVVHTVNNLTMQNATIPQTGIVLGDSIAFGLYSYWDGNLRKNADDIFSDVALTAAPVRISDWLAQYYGIPITNIAKRGTGWVADTRNLGNAWVTAQATDFSQYDFVALCFGVNDYIQKCTIGTISDNTVGTVIGNMIHTLEKIYTDNPLAKVVVFSPLNTWGQYRDSAGSSQTLYGDASTHYALGYDFGGTSYTLQDLIDALESVCDRYDVRHVIMSQGCTVNVFNIKDILIDGLHPSQESMKSIASDMFHTMMFR